MLLKCGSRYVFRDCPLWGRTKCPLMAHGGRKQRAGKWQLLATTMRHHSDHYYGNGCAPKEDFSEISYLCTVAPRLVFKCQPKRRNSFGDHHDCTTAVHALNAGAQARESMLDLVVVGRNWSDQLPH